MIARFVCITIALLVAFAFSALAANSYLVTVGSTVMINEHGQCRMVTNPTGQPNNRFISTKTASEWQSYINNPNGLGMTTCNCTLPWGGTIAEGASVTAYGAASVPCGSNCGTGTTRTCTGGVLTGTGDYASCSVAACASCALPWGGSIANGASVTAFGSASVACGGNCGTGTTRTCNNGTLSGTGNYASCSVAACASCTLDGVTRAHGASATFYSATTHANCSSISQSRTCNNGTYDGSATYQYASCAAAGCVAVGGPPSSGACCKLPWGDDLAHGAAPVQGYQTASVPDGQTCQSRGLICQHGQLQYSSNGSAYPLAYGEYPYKTCTVLPPSGGCFDTWTTRESSRNWRAVASSASGAKLVAAVNGGQIYTSTDRGVTWTARESNRNWSAVASSADGTKLVALVSGGQIYTSTDSGATWTARATSQYWSAVASSADGVKLAATVTTGQIYTSTNSGASWAAVNGSGQGSGEVFDWGRLDVSDDGTKMVANYAAFDDPDHGLIVMSTNGGTSWTDVESTGRPWRGVKMSADGKVLAGITYNDKIYVSKDYGASWSAQESSRAWNSIDVSGDGTLIIATADGSGPIYISNCSGTGCSGGQLVGGYCWVKGAASQSCTNVCSSRGGVNMTGTKDYAGSGGTLSNCLAVAAAFGVTSPADTFTGSCGSSGLGCQITTFTTAGYTSDYEVLHCSSPATTEAATPTNFTNVPFVWAPDALSGSDLRLCACNN